MKFKIFLLMAIALSILSATVTSCTARDSGDKAGVTALVTHNEFTVSPLTTVYESMPEFPGVRLFSQPEQTMQQHFTLSANVPSTTRLNYAKPTRFLPDERCKSSDANTYMTPENYYRHLLTGVRTRWLSKYDSYNKS